MVVEDNQLAPFLHVGQLSKYIKIEIRSFLGATGNELVEESGSGEEARGGGPRVAAELTSVVALQHVEPVLKFGYANLFLQVRFFYFAISALKKHSECENQVLKEIIMDEAALRK